MSKNQQLNTTSSGVVTTTNYNCNGSSTCSAVGGSSSSNSSTPSSSPNLKCKHCKTSLNNSNNNSQSESLINMNNTNNSNVNIDSNQNKSTSIPLLVLDSSNLKNNTLSEPINQTSSINVSNSSESIQKNANPSTSNISFNNLNNINLKTKHSLSDLAEQLISTSTNNNSTNAANFLNRNICIIERLSYLYLNESLADVHFVLFNTVLSTSSHSTTERIPAHKLILSIGSQVFMAMFYGTGSQMQQSSEITIPDVEIDAFKHMLRYLYTDELYIEADTVMSTLYVAKKYAVTALEQECVDFLKTNLKADNAFMLLQQARLFDETQLAEMCLNIIDKNSCESFSSECFLDLDLETLMLILKRDTLGIREYKLYYYLTKWAQSQCAKKNITINRENQKTVLGDALKYVRFPLMTKEEFALVMSDHESRLIDDDSIIDLFVNLTLSNNNSTSSILNTSTTALPKKLSFNDTPRCCLGGKEQVINRFCQVESRWGYSGTSDRVRFSVNKRIFVVGFGLYGSIYGKCEYQVLIQLIRFDSCTTCAQNSTTFVCDGTNSTFRVLFKEPVEVSPDTDYIAAATLKGPDSFYGTKGLRKVNHENMTVGKITFQFQYASGMY
jgi:BTB/POZ domain-containing protein 1/2